MAVAGILLFVISPLLAGALITFILREKNAGMLETYLAGFLSLFAFFLACILVALKLDMPLSGLAKIYLYPVAVISLIGIVIIAIRQRKLFRLEKPAKDILLFVIPAVFIWAYSYLLLYPSVVNDDTFEIVLESITTDSVYLYSSMTGKLMEAGLPIFNKVYVMPMFISVFCGFFGISAEVFAGYILPSVLFVLNCAIVYKLAKELKVLSKSLFMLAYLMVLMAGTYLPTRAIPVTTGYALLREGYSGYAVAYAVLIPFVLYLCVKKRYVYAVLMAMPIVGLVRLDRIFYACVAPIETYKSINSAGKLLGLYFIALCVFAVMRAKKKERVPVATAFAPGILIAFMAELLVESVKEKKARTVMLLCIAVIIYAGGSFTSFTDAKTRSEVTEYRSEVAAALDTLDMSGSTIWASQEFLSEVRFIDSDVYTIYGRDDYTQMLSGLDYEKKSDNTEDYRNGFMNLISVNTFYPIELTMEEIMEEASKEADYLILPIENDNPNLLMFLSDSGYTYETANEKYMIYRCN